MIAGRVQRGVRARAAAWRNRHEFARHRNATLRIGATAVTHDYTRRLYGAMQNLDQPTVAVRAIRRGALLAGRYDIVHVHWEDRLIKAAHPARSWTPWRLALRVAKRRGTTVVLTLHNLFPHDRRPDGAFGRAVTQFDTMVDGVITHGPSAAALLAAHRPTLASTRQAVIPIGPLGDDWRPPTGSAAPPAGTLALISFGRIRRYKGLDELITTVAPVIAEDPDVSLHVHGMAHDARLAAELRALADEHPQLLVDARPAMLDDTEVAGLLARSSALILAYRAVLTSGAAMLGLAHGVPVIAPRLGHLPDLAESVGPEWVWLYDQPFTADTWRGAIAWLRNRPADPPPPTLPTWADIARATAGFFVEVRSGHPTRRPRRSRLIARDAQRAAPAGRPAVGDVAAQ